LRFLLDTSIFLWGPTNPERLNRRAQEILGSGREDLSLSAASVWEIAIKYQLGKLRLPEPPVVYIPSRLGVSGIRALEITHLHAMNAGELPLHHQDPFDRMLIAQARLEGMTLLTADRVFEKYAVEMIWCGA